MMGVLSTFSSLWALAESKVLWWGQARFDSQGNIEEGGLLTPEASPYVCTAL